LWNWLWFHAGLGRTWAQGDAALTYPDISHMWFLCFLVTCQSLKGKQTPACAVIQRTSDDPPPPAAWQLLAVQADAYGAAAPCVYPTAACLLCSCVGDGLRYR